ncbi:MAG TPA: DUF4082 domain-containing protein [Longimicrobiaceae bacterium]|nr:DUF4082 domain-containing protein [Longimicrobiaceae bacterium]
MRRILLTAAAALALAACADGSQSPAAPASPRFAYGDQWTIFNGGTPASTLDATGGWEVGTRFYSTVAGCVTRLHFYRAAGETGTNTVKLWTNTGTLLYSHTFNIPHTGWNYIELRNHGLVPYVDFSVCLVKGTYYRVSVNTNTKQVKTMGYFDGGPVIHGPLVADKGFYGQPTGSMPTTATGSGFFVDVTFTEGYP